MNEKKLSKYQIDINKLNQVTKISPMKKYLTWMENALGGYAKGAGGGSSVVFFLGWVAVVLIGLTLSALVVSLGAMAAGVAAGIYFFLRARAQSRIDEEELKMNIDALEKSKSSLKDSILDYAETLRILNGLIQERFAAIKNLSPQDEQELLNGDNQVNKVAEFRRYLEDEDLQELQKLINLRRQMLQKLCASLNMVSGETYVEKLAHLFEAQEHELQAKVVTLAIDSRKPQIKEGWTSLVDELKRVQDTQNKQTATIGRIQDTEAIEKNSGEIAAKLSASYQAEKKLKLAKAYEGKGIAYSKVAFGSFLTGITTYYAVGTIIVGGAATLLTGGLALPFLIGGLAFGLACLVTAVLYQRNVEKKKERAEKMLKRSTTTLTTLTEDIAAANKMAKDYSESLKVKQQVNQQLKGHENEVKHAEQLGILKGYIRAQSKLQSLEANFNDIQHRIAAHLSLHKNYHTADESLSLELTTLKKELNAIKSDFDQQAQNLGIDESGRESLSEYQSLDQHLKSIDRSLKELETRKSVAELKLKKEQDLEAAKVDSKEDLTKENSEKP